MEAPEVLLSDKEWKQVKEKSNARQDSALPCVICKEDFGLQQQVRLNSTVWAHFYLYRYTINFYMINVFNSHYDTCIIQTVVQKQKVRQSVRLCLPCEKLVSYR